MMKASQDRLGSDDADALNCSMERGIFVERAMNSRPIIIVNILAKDPTQMRLPKYDVIGERPRDVAESLGLDLSAGRYSGKTEVAPVSWTPELWSFRSPQMARKHPPYTPEFRRQMIELVRAGRTPEELAKEFEPSAQTIRNWVAQADRDAGRREDGLTTAERGELSRLRRENRQLKLEREILSKAAAWFARETDVIPPKGSNS